MEVPMQKIFDMELPGKWTAIGIAGFYLFNTSFVFLAPDCKDPYGKAMCAAAISCLAAAFLPMIVDNDSLTR